MKGRPRTYLKLELAIAEEGRLAQYLKTLIVFFGAQLVIISIQIRVGLDETRQPLNVRNDPFQSLFEVV